jgi:hypothetical protein
MVMTLNGLKNIANIHQIKIMLMLLKKDIGHGTISITGLEG